jgi:hypothetical protein
MHHYASDNLLPVNKTSSILFTIILCERQIARGRGNRLNALSSYPAAIALKTS